MRHGLMKRLILLLGTAISASTQTGAGVYVNRYDAAATGANLHETALTPAAVKAGFGKLYSYYVDGAVFAQPLYAPGVAIPGRGARNVLYVATTNDRVYAFDADHPGAPLWMRNLTDEMAGITPVPVTDITNNNDLNVVGNVGIMGTPVIDPRGGRDFPGGAHPRKRKARTAAVQIGAGWRKGPGQAGSHRGGVEKYGDGRDRRHAALRPQGRQSTARPRPGERQRDHRLGVARGHPAVPWLDHGVQRGDASTDRGLLRVAQR